MTEPLAAVNPTPGVPDAPGGAGDAPAQVHHRLTQTMVLIAVTVCVALAWQAGAWLDLPAYRGYEASLLQQPGLAGKLLSILVVAAVVVACTAVGQLIAGRWWLYAGLLGAAAGLAALSARGGPSRYVYFHAATYGGAGTVFLMLMLELAMVVAVVGAIWYTLTRRAERATAQAGGEPLVAAGLTHARLKAVGLQGALMAFAVLVFVQSDGKQGVLIGVFLAAFAGTSLAEYRYKDAKAGAWYWVGPLAVGAVGYLLNQLTGGVAGTDGQLRGMFAALARPLPLDYAAMGTAGALLGYWVGADHPELGVGILMLHVPNIALRAGGGAVGGAALPSENRHQV